MILWEGVSLIDGESPAVAIATGTGTGRKSRNRKTGGIPQVWILRSDVSPIEAVGAGKDTAICGECPHRWSLGGACYVNPGQAPGSIWRAYRRGVYGPADWSRFEGLTVRIGAYGDPAAVPVEVWNRLSAVADRVLGYTHQWKKHPALASVAMASVDSLSERWQAKALGFRSFRVESGSGRSAGEALCPASAESRAGLSCAQCGACDGRARGVRGDIVIRVHGTYDKRFKESA